MRLHLTFCAVIAIAAPAWANDLGGELNPEEMTIGRVLDNARSGRVDMMTCASGYFLTKAGRHAPARAVFEACAKAGHTGAMTWMSQLDDNGLGGPANPEAAADWDRRAAEAGDPIGKFNYGLDLMRGHGVVRDEAAGRAWVDQAAEAGLPAARRMRDAGYDLDEVTPDADAWKYEPKIY